MGDTTYSSWKARLEMAKVPTHDGDPDVGFYRKPVRAPRSEGNAIIGWEAVAYFMEGTTIVGVIGDRDMSQNEVTDLWTYVCAYPIPEDVYKDVADHGKDWPSGLIGEPKRSRAAAAKAQDAAAMAQQANTIPAAGREVAKTDNAPPEEVPVIDQIRERVANAKRVAEGYQNIPDDDVAAKAAGARNLINEIKLQAEKQKEAEFRPHKEAADKVSAAWNPIIREAEDVGKAILRELRAHETRKREAAAAAQAKIDEENRRIAAANERAIDKAFESGDIENVTLVAPKAIPEDLQPKAKIEATYGRSVSFREKDFVVVQNLDEVYQHFKTKQDVINLLTTLAQRDIDAGLTVPGTTTKKGVT